MATKMSEYIIGRVSPHWTTPATRPDHGVHLPATKHCPDCDKDFPVGYFAKNHSTPDGRETRCMSCQRVYDRSLREMHTRGVMVARGHPGGTKYTKADKRTLTPLEAFPTGKKVCSVCGQEKPISAFPTNRRGRGGLNFSCRECKRKYERERLARTRAEARAAAEAEQQTEQEEATGMASMATAAAVGGAQQAAQPGLRPLIVDAPEFDVPLPERRVVASDGPERTLGQPEEMPRPVTTLEPQIAAAGEATVEETAHAFLAGERGQQLTVREWLLLEQTPSVLACQAQSEAEATAGVPREATLLLWPRKEAPLVLLTPGGTFAAGRGESIAANLASTLIGHWTGVLFY